MKQILTFFFLSFICVDVAAQKLELPAELGPYVMPGYEAMDLVKGDLNNDKTEDYILVLKVLGEDTMTFDNPNWESNRPMIIITRDHNGKLTAAGENSSIVMCRLCGGMMGDPYQGITIYPGEFRVELAGGSSWRWNSTYAFKYDANRKNWFLNSHGHITFNAGDPASTTEESMISRSEIGDINLEDFTHQYNTDSSNYIVKSPKSFFYSSPQLNSKPKKAYIVKGDKVKSYKKFKNFVECTYTNSRGVTTSGYLLVNDLAPAE